MSRKVANRTLKYSALSILTVVFVIPLYILVTISAKSDQEFLLSPLTFPLPFRVSNYVEAIVLSKFFRLFGNSIKIASCTVILILFASALAAYPLARRRNRFYGVLYVYFVAGLMIPFQLIMIPLYRIMNDLRLVNSHIGVIGISTGIGLPFVVFFFVGFLKTIPRDFEEAALIDGASRFGIFLKIVMPLMKPAIGTVAVIQTIWVWNEFLIPLLFLYGYDRMTIIVGIYNFIGERATRWNMIFALILVSIIPILIVFILLQKHIIRSFVVGGLKG